MSLLKDSRGRLLIFILAILFSACQGGITQRYIDQQGHWMPVYDSAGKIIGNTLAYDSLYKYEPGFGRKFKISAHNGTLTSFWVLLSIAVILIVIGILYGNSGGKMKALPIVLHLLSIPVAGAGVASIEWGHTKEFEIPKTVYDSAQSHSGGIDAYIDQHLYE